MMWANNFNLEDNQFGPASLSITIHFHLLWHDPYSCHQITVGFLRVTCHHIHHRGHMVPDSLEQHTPSCCYRHLYQTWANMCNGCRLCVNQNTLVGLRTPQPSSQPMWSLARPPLTSDPYTLLRRQTLDYDVITNVCRSFHAPRTDMFWRGILSVFMKRLPHAQSLTHMKLLA